MALKPENAITVSALTAIAVLGVFQVEAPNMADVKASAPGGAAAANTHKSVKTATWTAAILVSALGLLARDPTVYIVGGLVTVAEAWKYHYANVTDAKGNVAAPGSAVTGQPSPTLNG
jgi:hypothetical protein